VNLATGTKRVKPIRPLLTPRVGPFLRRNPFWCLGLGHRVKTLMTGPFTRGRAAVAASSQGEGVRGAPVLAGWRHGVEARACPGEAGSHDARQLKTYWMWHR
jgi:hypothetical protein